MVYKVDEVPKGQKRLSDFFEQSNIFYFLKEEVCQLETDLVQKSTK